VLQAGLVMLAVGKSSVSLDPFSLLDPKLHPSTLLVTSSCLAGRETEARVCRVRATL